MNDKQNKKLHDILEIVIYLKDNMVHKDEFVEFKQYVHNEFKNVYAKFDKVYIEFDKIYAELDKVRDEIICHVDGFVGLHKHLETEFYALKAQCDRNTA